MASSQLLQNLGDGVTYVSSKMQSGTTSAVWELEITDYSKTSNLGLENLSFDMDIGGDRKLRFFLCEDDCDVSEEYEEEDEEDEKEGEARVTNVKDGDYLHHLLEKNIDSSDTLHLGLRFSGDKFQSFNGSVAFYIDVECLDKTGLKLKTLCKKKHVDLQVKSYLKKMYSFANFDASQDNDVYNVSSDPANKHYIFRLTVTHSNFNTSKIENGSADLKKTFEGRFLQQMKDGFYGVNKYPDVTLISSDLMEHGAHKFMLAARSPILAKTIEDEVKKETFDGKIQLNVGAKPLVAILHWLYTGELHEKSGKCMKDVVAAAVKYELLDLLKLLDKELINLCQNENMAVVFSLFEIAKEHEMENARKEIGRFIRKNLQD